MHLAAGVVERRDAEEVVLPALAVMVLLHDGGRHHAAVVVQDGLGEAGGPRGEVEGRVVLLGDVDRGRLGRAIRRDLAVALGERRAVGAHEEARIEAGHPVDDGLHPAHELRPEDQRPRLRELEAVLDLLRGVAIVQRHRDRAGLEDAEVDREPLQAVHEQDRYLVALADAPAQQQVRRSGWRASSKSRQVISRREYSWALVSMSSYSRQVTSRFSFTSGLTQIEADLVAVERGVARE